MEKHENRPLMLILCTHSTRVGTCLPGTCEMNRYGYPLREIRFCRMYTLSMEGGEHVFMFSAGQFLSARPKQDSPHWACECNHHHHHDFCLAFPWHLFVYFLFSDILIA